MNNQALEEILVVPEYELLHQNYGPQIYRAIFGHLCAITQLSERNDVIMTVDIYHPNVLRCWGVTDIDKNNLGDLRSHFLFDCINCNLDELQVNLALTNFQPGPILIDMFS